MTIELREDLSPTVSMIKDSTYEIKVPIAGRPMPHVLPNTFRTKEAACAWLRSPEAKELIRRIREKYKIR